MLSKQEFYKLCLKQALKDAWGFYGHTRGIEFTVRAIFLIVLFGGGFAWLAKYQTSISKWVTIGAFLSFVILFVSRLLPVAFKIYQLSCKDSEFNDQHWQLLFEQQRKETLELRAKVETLTNHTDKAENEKFLRQVVQHRLADCVARLYNRQTEVRQMSPYAFTDEVEKTEKQKCYELLESIAGILRDDIDPATAAIFQTAKPEIVQLPPGMMLTRQQILLNFLEGHLTELKKIVTKFNDGSKSS